MHKIVNGQVVQLSQAEIIAQQEAATAWEAGAFDRAIADLRQRRNALLAKTDWIVLPDSPVEPAGKSKIMTYRATLRNITKDLETVEDVKAVQLPGIPVL